MTGYEALMRQHTNASDLFRIDRDAWMAYRRYILQMCRHNIPNSNRFSVIVFNGDATSHLLFRKWQAARRARDGVSNPRHKRNSIRFQRRGRN